MQEGGNRGKEKKKEKAVSKNLHLLHPNQHVSLSGVRAEMRFIKLHIKMCKHLRLSSFCLREEEVERSFHCSG